MSTRRVTVALADGSIDRISEVARTLAQRGMRIEQQLEAAGVITGSVDESVDLEQLRSVPGVAGIEDEGIYQLPPPDSGIQ
jgi:hypothetical protein